MSLADLTARAVEDAILEYDFVGGEEFLKIHGFRESRGYWLVQGNNRYPSKAIAGVAHKYLSHESETLRRFSGGQRTVARKLRQLGYAVETPVRNPDWARDELILALDLYFTNPANPPSKTSTAVAELSEVLNKLHRIAGGTAGTTFRNAAGVYMKMMNIRAIDPKFVAQGKVGMKAGGSLEKTVWAEYEGRREALVEDANAIRNAVEIADEVTLAKLPQADHYEGEEGGVIIQLHKRYERDPKLVAEKRKAAVSAGSLACEVCGFDFKEKYGGLGDGYIEVHHLKPVHMMKRRGKTKLTELALLCANCHRMAHRMRVPLTLAQLRLSLMSTEIMNSER